MTSLTERDQTEWPILPERLKMLQERADAASAAGAHADAKVLTQVALAVHLANNDLTEVAARLEELASIDVQQGNPADADFLRQQAILLRQRVVNGPQGG